MFINELSKDIDAPNTKGIMWGDAIQSVVSQKKCPDTLGTRGSRQQQDVKRAIMSSLMIPNTDNNSRNIINNKRLIRLMLPHKKEHHANTFIDKCLKQRMTLRRPRMHSLSATTDDTECTRESMCVHSWYYSKDGVQRLLSSLKIAFITLEWKMFTESLSAR